MKLSGQCVPAIMLTLASSMAAAVPARTQHAHAETETLDFERPESWGMKYYASLALLTGMGAPHTRAAGEIELGFEGGYVPQLSDAERRIGFGGTKLVVGLELVAGYHGHRRFQPYAGIGLNYMDLEFRVNAVYAGGLVEDHAVQLTSGTTLFATAGLTFAASERVRFTAELFHSWLNVARPPSTTSANEGFLNGRVLVTYRAN